MSKGYPYFKVLSVLLLTLYFEACYTSEGALFTKHLRKLIVSYVTFASHTNDCVWLKELFLLTYANQIIWNLRLLEMPNMFHAQRLTNK